MFTDQQFVALPAAHAKPGDLVQKDGYWLLVVEGPFFLVLHGSGRGRLLNLGEDYILGLKKVGKIEIGFNDMQHATGRAGADSIAVFTDQGLRLAGRHEGDPWLLFDESGVQLAEEGRIRGGEFNVRVTLTDGSTQQLI
ncbi:hypothetical protein [Stenotrophomonas sp.]|uniref:hypothetical protein n=1 Tax=Stenotrophomonas sp. TaxID=69392 RepID=UPI0028A9401F|nr:hypothetical protein [Stenotrophomonas sp.]